MREIAFPEWSIPRERLQTIDAGDEVAQDIQFISYLLVFGSSANYKELGPAEATVADRLLRMGVLTELGGPERYIMLTKVWKRAFERVQSRRP